MNQPISNMTSRSFTPSNMTPPPIFSHSQLFFFYLSQYELEEMFIEKVKDVSRLQILPFSRQMFVKRNWLALANIIVQNNSKLSFCFWYFTALWKQIYCNIAHLVDVSRMRLIQVKKSAKLCKCTFAQVVDALSYISSMIHLL